MSGATETPHRNFLVTCGLEVHQQLDTGKLFSRTPTTLREDTPDFTFHRRLHAVASELGEFDPAALEIAKRKYSYVYQGYHENTSLVEIDEEPIHAMDEEALRTAVEVSLLCHSTLVDNVLVMRKTVIDGSNTSGFQRTAQISLYGFIELNDGTKIRIQGLAVEEDSARTIEKKEKEIVYRLDRLGFPLIEVATFPDIHSPQQAKETALKMGEALRITGKVKRGLGTIRQDINISVPHGARVELKGVQELELIDEYVKREMQRQNTLLEVKKELLEKGLTHDLINNQAGLEATELFRKSQSTIIQNGLHQDHKIMAVRVPLMKGYFGKEVQPGRRVGTEVSDYVKARSHGMGMMHGDELPKFGITQEEVDGVRKLVYCQEKDSFALVIGEEKQALHAIEVIKHRVGQLLEGIPEETRNALEGGNSEYSRPLPGAARMYPETDAHEIPINPKIVEEIQKGLPRWAEERKRYYMQKGLSEKLADEMKLDNKARLFERLLEKGYDATTTATLLLTTLNTLRRKRPGFEKLLDNQVETLLAAEKKKTVMREHFPTILSAWMEDPTKTFEEVLHEMNVQRVGEDDISKIVYQIVEKNQHLVLAKGMQAQKALMGLCMQALRGKAQGYAIAQALEKEIKQRIGK